MNQRIPKDRADVAEDCPTCPITVLVDELGIGMQAPFSGFSSSFGVVPYIAAEYVQGLTLNVTNVDYFTLQQNAPTALLSSTGSTQLVGSFFSSFVPLLPSAIDRSQVTDTGNGLFPLVGTAQDLSSDATVFLVNTNTSVAYSVNLTASGFPTHTCVDSMTWNASSTTPIQRFLNQPFPLIVVLPPESVGIWISESGSAFGTSRLTTSGGGAPLPVVRLSTDSELSPPVTLLLAVIARRPEKSEAASAKVGSSGRKTPPRERMHRRRLIFEMGPRP